MEIMEKIKDKIKKRDLATMKIAEMDLEPKELESLMFARTMKHGFYILLFVVVFIVVSPVFSDYFLEAQIPVSGMLAVLNWVAIPLSAVIGAILARWKGIENKKEPSKEEDIEI